MSEYIECKLAGQNGLQVESEGNIMEHRNKMVFTHRGHRVEVSHASVTVEFQGANDMKFNVIIDGQRTVVPGIWNAYKKASNKGIELVVKALLDGRPVGATTG